MNKLIVANWKMQLTQNESISWLNQHLSTLENTVAQTSHKLVICPSFPVLAQTAQYPNKNIAWGAQDCSFLERGALTGDVSALSLKELNCSYTLVGHSERRMNYGETDERIARKAALLIEQAIEPIVCIGETADERKAGIINQVLERQLKEIMTLIKSKGHQSITIAYEPVWAIGTGVPASAYELNSVFSWIRQYIADNSNNTPLTLLYGGSIGAEGLENFSEADGLLVGKASIDPEVLKKIILSW